MSAGLPLLGDVLITGLGDCEDGLMVYIGPRYKGWYVLVTDAIDIKEVKREWSYGQHTFMKRPPTEAIMRKEVTE